MSTTPPTPEKPSTTTPAPFLRSLKEVEENHWFYQWYVGERAIREQRATYFEKLALFNSATIALVVTAILGPAHNVITHRYTLRAAICCLVWAMVLLIVRNFIWTSHEARIVSMGLSLMVRNGNLAVKESKEIDKLSNLAGNMGLTGVGFTALGIVLLLVVVLPII